MSLLWVPPTGPPQLSFSSFERRLPGLGANTATKTTHKGQRWVHFPSSHSQELESMRSPDTTDPISCASGLWDHHDQSQLSMNRYFSRRTFPPNARIGKIHIVEYVKMGCLSRLINAHIFTEKCEAFRLIRSKWWLSNIFFFVSNLFWLPLLKFHDW